MSLIYHLTTRAEWEASRTTPEHVADSLAEEGFIHCSQDQEQMLRVANRLFAGQMGLIALAVDIERLTSPLVREPSRSGEIYPHIYGPLNTDAVVGVLSLTTGSGGEFVLEEQPQ
jgi:uncharacterized protein (DUF952 family)